MEFAISRIVGRCHVADSYRDVVRYFISRLKGQRKGWLKIDRKTRREILRTISICHQTNGAVYRKVMRGAV